MSFEKQVLVVVGKVLAQDDTASFAYGTLFVPEITARQAAGYNSQCDTFSF